MIITILLLGIEHALRMPSYAVRYELSAAADGPGLRLAAAAIGLSTRLGEQAEADGVSYLKCRCVPMVYGEKMLDWLLAKGAPVAEIDTAGAVLLRHIFDGLFNPSDAKKSADFTPPPAAG